MIIMACFCRISHARLEGIQIRTFSAYSVNKITTAVVRSSPRSNAIFNVSLRQFKLGCHISQFMRHVLFKAFKHGTGPLSVFFKCLHGLFFAGHKRRCNGRLDGNRGFDFGRWTMHHNWLWRRTLHHDWLWYHGCGQHR